MAFKKKDKFVPVTEEPVTSDEEVPVPPCGAWCFILGAAVGAFCSREQEHEGDHQIVISVFVEPRSRFTVNWSLEP